MSINHSSPQLCEQHKLTTCTVASVFVSSKFLKTALEISSSFPGFNFRCFASLEDMEKYFTRDEIFEHIYNQGHADYCRAMKYLGSNGLLTSDENKAWLENLKDEYVRYLERREESLKVNLDSVSNSMTRGVFRSLFLRHDKYFTLSGVCYFFFGEVEIDEIRSTIQANNTSNVSNHKADKLDECEKSFKLNILKVLLSTFSWKEIRQFPFLENLLTLG